jgi:hypothetical protein
MESNIESDKRKNTLYISLLVFIIIIIGVVFYYKEITTLPTKAPIKATPKATTKATPKATPKATTKATPKATTKAPTRRPGETLAPVYTNPPPATTPPTPPPPTIPPRIYIYTEPPSNEISSMFKGKWNSLYTTGAEYGPLTLVSSGENLFNIVFDNPNTSNDFIFRNYKTLKVDPSSLTCSILHMSTNLYEEIGKPIIIKNRAVKIGERGDPSSHIFRQSFIFTRSVNESLSNTQAPLPTNQDTNPYEGEWNTFYYSGTNYGPVTITYRGNGEFNISGSKINLDYIKVIYIDPDTLRCRFNYHGQSSGNYRDIGLTTMLNGKAIEIGTRYGDGAAYFKRQQ